MLIARLLSFRLTYYRLGVIEKIRRFKLLLFFVLAMIVPTVAFLFQVINSTSLAIISGPAQIGYFFNILIFQLFSAIWIGSQYDCLKITDFEDYLRTLNIPYWKLFSLEFIFLSIINLPFIAFLLFGSVHLFTSGFIFLSISHFIYLFISLFFLGSILVFSRPTLFILLLACNLVFVLFNNPLLNTLTVLLMISLAGILTAKKLPNFLKFNFSSIAYRLHFWRYFPNIYLNLKGLFVWTKVYTSTVLAVNLLLLFSYISIIYSSGSVNHQSAFLISVNAMMYFCALLTYKLLETRKAYGDYFNLLYSRMQFLYFDLISVFLIGAINYLILSAVSACIGLPWATIFKVGAITMPTLILFSAINRKFHFYGPVISLVFLFVISIFMRGVA